MIKYILRILGFLLLTVVWFCGTVVWFLLGDIRETYHSTKLDLTTIKQDFKLVLRDKAFC